MQRSFKYRYLILLLLMLVPLCGMAQSSSINAYSPYSMYGPGELITPGSVQIRSMGGIGIAKRTAGQVNTLNPASASVTPRKSFIFDVSIDGTHYRNSQPKYDSNGKFMGKSMGVINSGNIHNIAIAFPLAKGLGMSLNISPYSSVAYKVNTTDQNEDNWANIGRVQYGFEGIGDISEVKLSIGWAPIQKLSIGLAAKYYWGYIERKYQTTVTDQIIGLGNYSSTYGNDKYVVSNFKLQAGIQWSIIHNETRILTLGATYDLGGNLNPEMRRSISTSNNINQSDNVLHDDNTLELRVPHEVGVGVYFRDRTIAVGADYAFAGWGSGNSSYVENSGLNSVTVAYTNTHTIKLGFEITPRPTDVRNYLNRISYRVGARLGNYYQTFGGEGLNQLAITAGLGFPVKIWGASSINLGFEYGRISSNRDVMVNAQKVGLVTQNYYKISIGFSLFSGDTSDYWFVRQKFD